jgi:hypothetical protein
MGVDLTALQRLASNPQSLQGLQDTLSDPSYGRILAMEMPGGLQPPAGQTAEQMFSNPQTWDQVRWSWNGAVGPQSGLQIPNTVSSQQYADAFNGAAGSGWSGADFSAVPQPLQGFAAGFSGGLEDSSPQLWQWLKAYHQRQQQPTGPDVHALAF